MSRFGEGSEKTCPSHQKTTELYPPDPSSAVTLLADAGESVADSAEFFRSPEFLSAEEVTHSLKFPDDGPVLPLLVRDVPGTDLRDAISPYGYPGASGVLTDPIQATELDWSQAGLVSLFLRDAIGVTPCLADGTERSRVWISDPSQGSGIRKRLREQIRRNERRGWDLEITQGPDVSIPQLAGFSRAYAETMARTGATDRYLFDDSYFETLFGSTASWLVTASNEGEILAGAIAVRSDEMLHYFLGGTAEAGLGDSPMKNLFASMIDFSNEIELPLNLGGGVTPGDSLDQFKRGFANADAPFITHEVICDSDSYAQLVSKITGDPPDGFFPAYRAGS